MQNQERNALHYHTSHLHFNQISSPELQLLSASDEEALLLADSESDLSPTFQSDSSPELQLLSASDEEALLLADSESELLPDSESDEEFADAEDEEFSESDDEELPDADDEELSDADDEEIVDADAEEHFACRRRTRHLFLKNGGSSEIHVFSLLL
jgi:hypothetical protein